MAMATSFRAVSLIHSHCSSLVFIDFFFNSHATLTLSLITVLHLDAHSLVAYVESGSTSATFSEALVCPSSARCRCDDVALQLENPGRHLTLTLHPSQPPHRYAAFCLSCSHSTIRRSVPNLLPTRPRQEKASRLPHMVGFCLSLVEFS